jgi:hypothetical protein
VSEYVGPKFCEGCAEPLSLCVCNLPRGPQLKPTGTLVKAMVEKTESFTSDCLWPRCTCPERRCDRSKRAPAP